MVIVDGAVFATVSAIRSDVGGVRVSIDWAEDVFNGIERLEDMSTTHAVALADARCTVARTLPAD
ncbi:hypothetical protein [Nocardioides sp.]|uniref:hypothetical protein n=1 Tax=Nocardioides sp. TaxID=35761 RepID=UPI003510F112